MAFNYTKTIFVIAVASAAIAIPVGWLAGEPDFLRNQSLFCRAIAILVYGTPIGFIADLYSLAKERLAQRKARRAAMYSPRQPSAIEPR